MSKLTADGSTFIKCTPIMHSVADLQAEKLAACKSATKCMNCVHFLKVLPSTVSLLMESQTFGFTVQKRVFRNTSGNHLQLWENTQWIDRPTYWNSQLQGEYQCFQKTTCSKTRFYRVKNDSRSRTRPHRSGLSAFGTRFIFTF